LRIAGSAENYKKGDTGLDRITKNLLAEFLDQNGLQKLDEARAFEHFAGYLVTSGHHSESFFSGDIVTGGGGDSGIDTIAILVNGTLVTEPEEVEDLAETNGFLDVAFVFSQAKRSTKFESSQIGQFAFGVRDFFAEEPQLPQNDRVKLSYRIAQEIFDRSKLFRKGNPRCLLYYVTAGKWTEDPALVARKEAERLDVEQLGLFREVLIDCVDAGELQRLYRESQNAVATEVVLSERTVIPEIPGVEQAYIGLLPVSQFLRLIENDKHEVMTALFYDNVRHWQDWNPVNAEMRETLSTEDTARYFPLMNNGVTVVARRINPTGNRLFLEDYQIVNGCQTSYVLHECRDGLGDDVMVPVRLIATRDEDIKNRIIKATNRQTQVSEEQLFALAEFPKRLEAYFPTFEGKKRLYYERRSRQYNAVAGVEKVRVISMTYLVRAFASIFRTLPHRTTRNYKALLKGVGTDIFNPEDRLEPYYVAAYAHYRLEFLFRNQVLSSDLKPARYHLLLAFRLLSEGADLPRMNSREMARLSERLMECLWDDDKSLSVFERAVGDIRTIAEGNLHRDNIRTEPFTEALVKHLVPPRK
jgi:hypothetical protein